MISDDTLQKLKVLADRGIGGEKTNASDLLEKICKKYNILLEEMGSEKIEYHWFAYPRGNKYFKQLLYQCIFKTLGPDNFSVYRRGKRSEIGAKCTMVQAVEIQLDFEFYSINLTKELERMTSAFIQVNDIFPKNCKTTSKEENSDDKFLRAGINRKTRSLELPHSILED